MGRSRCACLPHCTSQYVIGLTGCGGHLHLLDEFTHIQFASENVPAAAGKGQDSPGDRLSPHLPHSRCPAPGSSRCPSDPSCRETSLVVTPAGPALGGVTLRPPPELPVREVLAPPQSARLAADVGGWKLGRQGTAWPQVTDVARCLGLPTLGRVTAACRPLEVRGEREAHSKQGLAGGAEAAAHLVGVKPAPHDVPPGEHVHAHVDVGQALAGLAAHARQVLLPPVVVGEDAVAGIEEDPAGGKDA